MKPLPELSADDTARMDRLYRQYAATVLRYIRRQVNSLEEAEDLLLDVFIAALQSEPFKRLADGEQHAWLNRVAHNKCIDYYRLMSRRPTVALDVVVSNLYEEEEHEPHSAALHEEELHVLRQRLTLLTDQQQAVLRYKFGYDMSSPEIARRLQKSESAVRMTLARALTFLRDLYHNDDERRHHQ